MIEVPPINNVAPNQGEGLDDRICINDGSVDSRNSCKPRTRRITIYFQSGNLASLDEHEKLELLGVNGESVVTTTAVPRGALIHSNGK
jgi:hypothetical protein